MKYLYMAGLLFLAAGANAQSASAIPEQRFVYVNNQNQPNTITAFQINSNGSLTQLAGSPFLTGGTGAQGPTESMAIVDTGSVKYLYAANGQDPSISVFTIDPRAGNIVPIAGSPFLLNDSAGGYNIAASLNRKFLFVTNEADTTIHAYALNADTGAITEIAGSPFQADANIAGIWVTANNKFLLAAGNSDNAIGVFAIAKSGALTPVPGSPFAANGNVTAVQSNCASNQVFAVENSTQNVDSYAMSATGTLTPVLGSPFSNGASGTGPNSFALVLSPNNQFLFTTDSFSTDITSFAVARNGALTQVAGSPFYTASWVGGAAITNKGDFLYAVDFASGDVVGEAVSADGTLTTVPGGEFGSGNQNSPGGEVNAVITYPAPACPSASSTN
jgi:6-phosphogluconolactonase